MSKKAFSNLIEERNKEIVVLFLIISLLLSFGIPMVTLESVQSEFSDVAEEQQAFNTLKDKLQNTQYDYDVGETQLLLRPDNNALSKENQIKLATAHKKLAEENSLKVKDTISIPFAVAERINPNADTPEEKLNTLKRASEAEIEKNTRIVLSNNKRLQNKVSTDYDPQSVEAESMIGITIHKVSEPTGTGPSSTDEFREIQNEAETTVTNKDITVLGKGIDSQELRDVILDSLLIVLPAAFILLTTFLIFAYKDLIDLLLGVSTFILAMIWTFGFIGFSGISFSQILVPVPVLLLGVGVDFGIHAINRYREERQDYDDISSAMSVAMRQLSVAFSIVAVTTIIGFSSNAVSKLGPVRDFGVAAAVGIFFTTLLFGIFLPSAKILSDKIRSRQTSKKPLGSSDSIGSVLDKSVEISGKAPYIFVIIILIASAGLGFYGSSLDSEFTQQLFVPSDDDTDHLEGLPEPVKPEDYKSISSQKYIDSNYLYTSGNSVVILVEGDLTKDSTLETYEDARQNPPPSFRKERDVAKTSSILKIVKTTADENKRYSQLVKQNDENKNGIPDKNLEDIYSPLVEDEDSISRNFITPEYTHAKVVYLTKDSASQTEIYNDAKQLEQRYESDGVEATATGSEIVYKAVSDAISQSLLKTLIVAIVLTLTILVIFYRITEGMFTLGIVNMIPVLISICWLLASMRVLGYSFNVLTGTALAVAIGLGVDYSAHLVHRFSDEYDGDNLRESIKASVKGTGGALTGSVLTTVAGVGTLILSITPLLRQFGVVVSLTVLFSYISAVFVTPAIIMVWDDLLRKIDKERKTQED